MRRILLLSLLGGCEESAQHREARLERERRFARGDCLHVVVKGDVVPAICSDGTVAFGFSSDEVVVVCPEDMPPTPSPERP